MRAADCGKSLRDAGNRGEAPLGFGRENEAGIRHLGR